MNTCRIVHFAPFFSANLLKCLMQCIALPVLMIKIFAKKNYLSKANFAFSNVLIEIRKSKKELNPDIYLKIPYCIPGGKNNFLISIYAELDVKVTCNTLKKFNKCKHFYQKIKE